MITVNVKGEKEKRKMKKKQTVATDERENQRLVTDELVEFEKISS